MAITDWFNNKPQDTDKHTVDALQGYGAAKPGQLVPTESIKRYGGGLTGGSASDYQEYRHRGLAQAEMNRRMADLERRYREHGTLGQPTITPTYKDMSEFLEEAVLALSLKTGEYDYITEVFGKLHRESRIKSYVVKEWLEQNTPEVIPVEVKDGKGQDSERNNQYACTRGLHTPS